MTQQVILIDIDGTLADTTHRHKYIQSEPKDWASFYGACLDDAPIAPTIRLVKALFESRLFVCAYVTGRPESTRRDTEEWLKRQGLPTGPIAMRVYGDHRPDYSVKREAIERLRANGWDPVLAIEDRRQVVDMYRAEGLICLQCAEGNF